MIPIKIIFQVLYKYDIPIELYHVIFSYINMKELFSDPLFSRVFPKRFLWDAAEL
jgi:hypothetical protein